MNGWQVRDRLTRERYPFATREAAEQFVADLTTSQITGEPLARWVGRLVVERKRDR